MKRPLPLAWILTGLCIVLAIVAISLSGYNEIGLIFREVADVIQGRRAQYEIRGNAYYDTPVGQMRFPVTVTSAIQ